MSLIVHQVPYVSGQNGQVYPITDRRLIDFAAKGQSGVVTGCGVTNPSGNTLAIATGWGIASGCIFSIASETVQAEAASSGMEVGELILQVDTSASTGTWITNHGSSTSALTQDDLTAADGIYQIRFATYQIDTSGNISDLTQTFDIVEPGETLPFEFGIDGNGNYGYIKNGETSVTPFDPWDIVVPVGYALTSNNGTQAVSGGVSASSAYGSWIIANVNGLGYTSATRTNGNGSFRTIKRDGTMTAVTGESTITLDSETKYVICNRTGSAQQALALSFS